MDQIQSNSTPVPTATPPPQVTTVPPVSVPSQVTPPVNQAADIPPSDNSEIKSLTLIRTIAIGFSVLVLVGGSSLIALRKTNPTLFQSQPTQSQIYFAEPAPPTMPTNDLNQTVKVIFAPEKWHSFNSNNSLTLYYIDQTNSNFLGSESMNFTVNKLINTTDIESATNTAISDKKGLGGFKLISRGTTTINGISFSSLNYQEKLATNCRYVQEYLTVANGKLIEIFLNSPSPTPTKLAEMQQVLNSISLVSPTETGKVKGAATSNNEEKIINLYKPAIVRVHSNYCGNIKYSDKLPFLAVESYDYCVGGVGSGFFVNPQGYLATNGHVVKMPTEIIVAATVMNGQPKELILNFVKEGILEAIKSGDIKVQLPASNQAEALQQAIDAAAEKETAQILNDPEKLTQIAEQVIKDWKDQYATVTEKETMIHVQTGNIPFKMDQSMQLQNQSEVPTAKLIATNFDPESLLTNNSSLGPDVALLKVDGKDFPTTSLGTISQMNSGASILILGFPALGTDNELLDTSSTTQVTATKGIVSAVKQTKDSNRMVVQTDAVISPGNSGGPGFDANGNVFGIATYSVGGNYNYLRDIQELKDLMAQHGIENKMGVIDQHWKSALTLYDEQKYRSALNEFNLVATAYPNHITVGSFVTLTKQKIANGEDRSYFFSDPFVLNVTIASVLLLLCSSVTTAALTLLINKKRQQTGFFTTPPPVTVANF